MKCKNCNNTTNANFCSFCGQKTRVEKISFSYLLKEFSNTVFQLDHGFLFTVKNLFTSPGYSIKGFLVGKRKHYFKPLAYVLLLSTIYALVAISFDGKTILADALSGWNEANKVSGLDNEKQITVLNWFVKNYAYTTLILLPLFSMASYLVFIESKYNYFEHIVLNSFITGQQALIYSLFIIIDFFFESSNYIELIKVLISIGYVYWTYVQFFKPYNILKTALLTFLSYLLYFLFIMVFITITLFITQLKL